MRRPRYSPVEWGDEITEIAMPVVSGSRESDIAVFGTAVLIAPHLVLAAEHVVSEIFQQFVGRPPAEARGELPFGVQLIQTWRGPGTTIRWDVNRYWMAAPLDVAVLGIAAAHELPPDFAWSPPRLDVVPPRIGSEIKAFGYPASTTAIAAGGAKVRLRPHGATGEVVDVHLDFRDKFRMKFPCFRTNARFDGAMSGGPVFDSRGRLVGLISSNLPPFEEGEDHVSYVSLLWPVMGIYIDSDVLPDARKRRRYPLIELSYSGRMRVFNADCVTVPDSEGGPVRFRVSDERYGRPFNSD